MGSRRSYTRTKTLSFLRKEDGTKIALLHQYDVGETNEVLAAAVFERYKADELYITVLPVSGYEGAMEPFLKYGKPVKVVLPMDSSFVTYPEREPLWLWFSKLVEKWKQRWLEERDAN